MQFQYHVLRKRYFIFSERCSNCLKYFCTLKCALKSLLMLFVLKITRRWEAKSLNITKILVFNIKNCVIEHFQIFLADQHFRKWPKILEPKKNNKENFPIIGKSFLPIEESKTTNVLVLKLAQHIFYAIFRKYFILNSKLQLFQDCLHFWGYQMKFLLPKRTSRKTCNYTLYIVILSKL